MAKLLPIFLIVTLGLCNAAFGYHNQHHQHNHNRFSKSDCIKPVQHTLVNCRARLPVWHWNQASQKCTLALFGGCNATKNNFMSKTQCYLTAAPVCAYSVYLLFN